MSDDMYWDMQQGQTDPNDYHHQTHEDDDWDGHDEPYDDENDDDDGYPDPDQPSGTHPHNSPLMGSQSGGPSGWEQPGSNWDHPAHAAGHAH